VEDRDTSGEPGEEVGDKDCIQQQEEEEATSERTKLTILTNISRLS